MEQSLFDKPNASQKTTVLTISQITFIIKTALENTLPGKITITGQISGFKQHSSGHCYFDLKDENAVLPCVMWKSDFVKLKFRPENGLAVVSNGHIDVYPPQGKYQFYADSMSPAGVGALQLAFEQLKSKLAAEGLFDDEHKKPLPDYPFRIGILTSKSGAALHDIIDSIFNRWPVAKMFFYDVPVQGDGAAGKIAAAIKDVNKRNSKLKLDVIIVGRGGGSMEDLWAFNEEAVARAIFNSKIPVISAVGHEVDFTIADFVADARASTPTKAGVIAVPDIKEVSAAIESADRRIKINAISIFELCGQQLKTILAAAMFRNPLLIVQNREQSLDGIENNLSSRTAKMLADAKFKLETQAVKLSAFSNLQLCEQRLKTILATAAFRDPLLIVQNRQRQLDELQSRLSISAKTVISRIQSKLQNYFEQLLKIEPQRIILNYKIALNNSDNRLSEKLQQILAAFRINLESQAAKLAACSPKSVLNRGYSITKIAATGKIIKNIEEIDINDIIITELDSQRLIESRIIRKK